MCNKDSNVMKILNKVFVENLLVKLVYRIKRLCDRGLLLDVFLRNYSL